MSVASKNLFSILGDDAEETPRVSSGPVREVVKQTTSSKKADAAPAPRAGGRAGNNNNNKKPAPTGNEAAFKDRNAGRSANRSKPTDGPAPSNNNNRRQKNPRPDRHSQTGKVDTAKKVHQGWGDDNKKAEDEAAGEKIAKDEAAAAAEEEATPVEEPDTSVTLEQYLEELKIKAAEADAEKQLRKPNEGADDAKWKTTNALDKKDQEAFFAASKAKTLKTKSKKEKVLLEIDATFAPPSSGRPERSERSGRDDRRGGRASGPRGGRAGRGPSDRKNAGPSSASKAKSVNIANPDDFPVLGA